MYTIANIRPFGHNIGNGAIHFALRNMLYDVFGRLVTIIDYPATSKHESTSKAGISKGNVHEFNRYVDGVIIGGGNLYENDEIYIDDVALKNLNPPLFLFSNSRGRIYGRNFQLQERSDVISDSKLKNLTNRADLSASRDRSTYNYICNLGSKDTIGFCPTININRFKHNLPSLPANEEVGALISIRTPNLMNIPVQFQSRITDDIRHSIELLKKNGHKRVRILCNDTRDLDYAQLFKGTNSVDTLYLNDVYEYLSVLDNASIVVSYRLHASLPSVSLKTPVVNITYDERAESLCEDLGLQKYSVSMFKNRNYLDKISTMIKKNGFIIDNHPDLVNNFNDIKNKQIGLLNEFKFIVEKYVNENRLKK